MATETSCDVCHKPIAPRLLMCALHWSMVPQDLQTQVQRAWQAFDGCAAMSQRLHLYRAYQQVRRRAKFAVTSETIPTGVSE